MAFARITDEALDELQSKVGTKVTTHSLLKELVEIPTKFAGRSVKQVYTTTFHDQHGARPDRGMGNTGTGGSSKGGGHE